MSDRKPAYIATVERIDNIEGKDRIKYVKLADLEWQVIVNIFDNPVSVGDKIVYVEYDTIIQPSTGFEWLRSRCWNEKYRGFRIRAMKMGGCISYGLILNLKDAEAIAKERSTTYNTPYEQNLFDPAITKDGMDVSEYLGIKTINDSEEADNNNCNSTKKSLTRFQRFVKKYLYFIWKLRWGNRRNNSEFPTFIISKSDETRIEKLSYMFGDEFQGKKMYSTVKMDGQSFTAAIYKNKFYIASRNLTKYCQPLKKAVKELVPSNAKKLGKFDDFIKIACILSLAKKMNNEKRDKNYFLLHNDYAIQGELCGPSKQGNHMGLKEDHLYLYNLYDAQEHRYFQWDCLEYFAKKTGIETVPFIEKFEWNFKNIKEIKAYAKGNYSNGYPREGVVIRSNSSGSDDKFKFLYIEDPLKNQHGSFSFKCINDDFALKAE